MTKLSNRAFADRGGQGRELQFSEQDIAAARRLLQKLVPNDRGGSQHNASPAGPANDEDGARGGSAAAQCADAVRAVMLARQGRRAIFASAIFGEPAWDMLLALYLAEFDQVRVTVTGLAERSGAALTTAIRWLDYLEQTHLVQRREHPTDRRVIFVELSAEGRAKLQTYFSALVEAGHLRA